jgi:hypothetical protein
MTRDELIRKLRRLARRRGLAFKVARERGEAATGRLGLARSGSRFRRSKGRDLKPGNLHSILREFGVRLHDLE